MSNNVPVVPITLDRERHLSFSMPAIFDLEDATGLSFIEPDKDKIDAFFNAPLKRDTIKNISVVLWAGLRSEDPNITREQAFALVCPANLNYVVKTVMEAYVGSWGGDTNEVKELVNPPEEQPSTGGVLPDTTSV